MKLLVIDYETCGTPKRPPFLPTELGMVVLCTETFRILTSYGTLINPGVEVDPFFLDFCKVTPEQLKQGVSRDHAAEMSLVFMDQSDCMMTWNGEAFDKDLFYSEIATAGYSAKPIPSFDLKIDGEFGDNLFLTAAKLEYLLAGSHTALADVIASIEVLKRSKLDVNQFIQDADKPYVMVFADVGYENREKARSRGFFFDKPRNLWCRLMREHKIPEAKEKFGFNVKPLAPIGKAL